MIPEPLSALLEPLEAVERIRRSVVRMGDRLCDLSYANPYQGVRASGREAIRAALDAERLLDLQYSPFGGQTLSRRAVADALRGSHGLPFTWQDVVLTPGAMAALQAALHACGEPGDEVVIPVPCWLDYPLYARASGRVAVMVPLSPERFDLDLDALADAITARTCAVLLCTPANPTGRSYPSATLAGLGALAREAESRHGCRITIIADETHRDFIDAERFASLADCYERTLIVHSFGKYHFMQGQRVGYAAVSPHHPERASVAPELVQWMRVLGLATPTALMQRALPTLLKLQHDLSWLTDLRQWLIEELTGAGYRVVTPDGTLFLYVRTPPDWDDMTLTRTLARRGVLVLPAPVFHHRGYFRIALTASQPMLARALHAFESVRAESARCRGTGTGSA